MTKLLYIESSPRGAKSVSSKVATRFLDTYMSNNPDGNIERVNVFEDDLPPFGEEGAGQKMKNIFKLIKTGKGIEPSGQWAGAVREIERLKSADKVILSAPMWNFSIPYRLKHYIDLICQPGLTFTVNHKGEYIGLLKRRPLQLILTSGSAYPAHFPQADDGVKTDFHRWYLEHIFRYIGFEDIRVITIQAVDAQPQNAEKIINSALKQAETAAAIF